MTENDAVPTLPLPGRCPFAPPAVYADLRARASLIRAELPTGVPVWLATRHATARRVLSDARISTDSTRPGFPLGQSDAALEPEQQRLLHEGRFADMDPPEHGVYRRMLTAEFSLRRVRALRPLVLRVVDQQIDAVLAAGPPADLVAGFARAVPSLVISELLGIPEADRGTLLDCATRMLGVTTSAEAAASARLELKNYLDDLVARAERRPADNLVGRLVTQRMAAGDLSHQGVVNMAAMLIGAGFVTTATMIAMSVLTLLEYSGQLAALRAEPRLWPGSVEELLRFHSVVDWAAFDRMALEDIEICGQEVHAGDGIFVLSASANHDERVFDRPAEFDIRRDARRHLAFGYGVHQCLGQHLARLEIELACRRLFERVTGLRLSVPVAELPFDDVGNFGLYRLPVTW
ncbi:cytochrome P450 [Amycolatopsis sp. NPDC003676]